MARFSWVTSFYHKYIHIYITHTLTHIHPHYIFKCVFKNIIFTSHFSYSIPLYFVALILTFYWYCWVQIDVSWFGKYHTIIILHNAVFPTYPENQDTKMWKTFIVNRETKFFLAVTVQNDFNMWCVARFSTIRII